MWLAKLWNCIFKKNNKGAVRIFYFPSPFIMTRKCTWCNGEMSCSICKVEINGNIEYSANICDVCLYRANLDPTYLGYDKNIVECDLRDFSHGQLLIESWLSLSSDDIEFRYRENLERIKNVV